MKKKIILIMMICFVGLLGCSNQASSISDTVAQSSETETTNSTTEMTGFDFGSTMEEVKKSKDSEPIAQDKNQLVYKEEFSGYNTLFLYKFNVDGKLEGMLISFTDKYSTTTEDEERFGILKTALTSIYGDFTLSKPHSYMWDNDNEQVLLSMEDDGKTVILFSDK